MNIRSSSSQNFVEAASLAAHDRLPVLAMAYSDTLKSWATATHNELNFIRWKRSDCEFSTVNRTIPSESRFQGHTFHTSPTDRIVAKRVVVSSEEERAVTVTSLNWITKSSNVAHLLVSFLHHHVEYVRSGSSLSNEPYFIRSPGSLTERRRTC